MPMFSTVSTGEARAGHVLSRVSMVSENVGHVPSSGVRVRHPVDVV